VNLNINDFIVHYCTSSGSQNVQVSKHVIREHCAEILLFKKHVYSYC